MSARTFKVSAAFDRTLKAGHAAILVYGNIYDDRVIDNKLVYLPEYFKGELKATGYVLVTFSRGRGARLFRASDYKGEERKAIDNRFNAVGLRNMINPDKQLSSDELRSFFLGMERLLQIPAQKGPHFALVHEYSEHTCPNGAVQETEEQLTALEVLHTLSHAPALRKSGHIVVCLSRQAQVHPLLQDFYRVEFPFPKAAETANFIAYALSAEQHHAYAQLEAGLTPSEYGRLTRGLRIQDDEAMLRDAKAACETLGRARVLKAKENALLATSEGTLSIMPCSLDSFDQIVGLVNAKRFFKQISMPLAAGDRGAVRAMTLGGPPGTGKSTFPPLLGKMCGFNVVKFENIKNMYVGESERLLRLALSLLESLAPVIIFIDEITETVPQRSQPSGDGGVSQDFLAQLFQFSSRDDLRGQVLLMAATNVPHRLDVAWLDRMIVVPFLELTPPQLCELVPILEKRIQSGKSTLKSNDSKIVEACILLYQKGCSPRRCFDVLNHAYAISGKLTADGFLQAAKDFRGATNPAGVAVSALSSIKLTSYKSLLPWWGIPDYPLPWYLEGLVDLTTGKLDEQKLDAAIAKYSKEANL